MELAMSDTRTCVLIITRNRIYASSSPCHLVILLPDRHAAHRLRPAARPAKHSDGIGDPIAGYGCAGLANATANRYPVADGHAHPAPDNNAVA